MPLFAAIRAVPGPAWHPFPVTSRRRMILTALVALVAATATALAIGLAEDDEPSGGDDVVAAGPAEDVTTPAGPSEGNGSRDKDDLLPPPESDPDGLVPGPSGPAPESTEERAAAAAARGYVRALARRDERAACAAFKPGALEDFEFPRGGPACASGVRASLGTAAKGRPKWKRSVMTRDVSAAIEGDRARVVATVFTVYERIREPTIEDDIVYLDRVGDSWLVAKPSATFYRAVGIAEFPPSVLTPPA